MSSNVELAKVYVRHREGYPETELGDYARRGFWTFGVEIAPFEWVDDIDDIDDLGPTVGVVGYLGDVERGLNVLGFSPFPNVDYPAELAHLMGRYYSTCPLSVVRSSYTPMFIKPVEQKLFSGFVWTGDAESRRRVVTVEDDVLVWISNPIEMVAEYRTYVFDGEILDCRRYKGNWSKAPDQAVVEEAVKCSIGRSWRGHNSRAFCLDFAVTNEGKTVLVERTAAMSFGHYGLHPTLYAKMLSAYWYDAVQAKLPAPQMTPEQHGILADACDKWLRTFKENSEGIRDAEFALIVKGALRDQKFNLADEFECARSTVTRWAKGVARPRPKIQRLIVESINRRMHERQSPA